MSILYKLIQSFCTEPIFRLHQTSSNKAIIDDLMAGGDGVVIQRGDKHQRPQKFNELVSADHQVLGKDIDLCYSGNTCALIIQDKKHTSNVDI